MKTSLAVLLIFIPIFTNAQISDAMFIDTSIETAGVTKMESVDLNNDGFDEIVTSTTGNAGRLGFYLNLTNNTYSTFNLIELFGFCKGFAVGDFNNDGWNDLVSIGGIDKEARIHINNSGTISPGTLLDSNVSIQINDVVVADFDGNSSDDIVIIGQHSIDYYRNNGSGSFTKEIILSTSTSPRSLECLDLATEDMDNDGDMDLIVGETEGLVVYENNGNAIFSPNYYSVIPEIYFLIHPFDIDNDGDMDVIGQNNSGQIKWFSNDGGGSMTHEDTLSHIPNLMSLNTIDHNNDGLEDIYVSYNNHISIFENNLNHSFNNEIIIHQDNSLLMGEIQIINIDNVAPLDYAWSGGTNTIAVHINQSLLSIDELSPEFGLFYPNPTKGKVYFSKIISRLELYNSLGKRITKANNVKSIDLSKLPSGIFFLIAKTNTGVSRHKIIKR